MNGEKQDLSGVQMPKMSERDEKIKSVLDRICMFTDFAPNITRSEKNEYLLSKLRYELKLIGMDFDTTFLEERIEFQMSENELRSKLDEISAICSVAMGFGTAYGNINAVTDWKNLPREEVLKYIQYICRRID